MTLDHLIDILQAAPCPEQTKSLLIGLGFDFKEHSRWVLTNKDYAVKIDVQPKNPQNRKEFIFYNHVPKVYKKYFPICYWLSPCTTYLIAEYIPKIIRHPSQWDRCMSYEMKPFLYWCEDSGLDVYDLYCYDSWRLTEDDQPKLVDFGAYSTL